MGFLDSFIVYKFVKLLTTAWDETAAFKAGVIDASGKIIVDTKHLTPEQSQSYGLFQRLVFNLKRLIEKIPGGKTKIGRYAAALYLFTEEMGDSEGVRIMEHNFMSYLKHMNALPENYLTEQYMPEEMLDKGEYSLTDDLLDTVGHKVPKGTKVLARVTMKPTARVLGMDVFKLQIANSNQQVVVSREDIQEL